MNGQVEVTGRRGAYYDLCGIRTCVPSMIHTLDQIQSFASLDTTVLIEGETGTGKELVARALHSLSSRADAPFVVVDCGSLPESLTESELFGHERGAYTGADRFYAGRIQSAHGGTLFLDEVNSISLATQTKLLRFLETQEFCRVGQRSPISVDARLITASNVPLDQLVAKQAIRRDFFYRINVLRLELPPLRERLDDLPLLVDGFLASDAMAKRLGVSSLAPTVLAELRTRAWPGNVRELYNTLRRFIAVGASGNGSPDSPSPLETVPPTCPELANLAYPTQLPFRAWMRECERQYFSELVRQRSGISELAQSAGLPQRTLYRKLRSHRLGCSSE